MNRLVKMCDFRMITQVDATVAGAGELQLKTCSLRSRPDSVNTVECKSHAEPAAHPVLQKLS